MLEEQLAASTTRREEITFTINTDRCDKAAPTCRGEV
jgi:hypothetical protein